MIFIDRVNAAEQPRLLRDASRPPTRAASSRLPPYGACLLGSINLARWSSEPFTPRARLDEAALERLVPHGRAHARQRHRRLALSAAAAGAGGQGQAPHRPWRHRPCRCADLLRRALRLARGRERSAGEWLGAIAARCLSRLGRARARRRAPSRCTTARAISRGRDVAGLARGRARGDRPHGIRNALPDLDRADRHDLAARRQRLVAASSRSSPSPTCARCCSPTARKREESVEDYADARLARAQGRRAAAGRHLRRRPDAHAGRSPGDAGRRAGATSTARSPRPSTARATSPSRPSRTSTSRPMRLGCKGCTTYRPNAVTGAVLEVEAGRVQERVAGAGRRARAAWSTSPSRSTGPRSCRAAPTRSNGRAATTRSTSPSTTSMQDGRRRPFEIFINSKNMEHYAWTVALTRMISAVFRRGGDVSFVVEELKAVFDPRGGQWMDGRYVPSLLAAIGGVIERHLVEIGFLSAGRPAAHHRGRRAAPAARRRRARAGRRIGDGGRGRARPMPELRRRCAHAPGGLRRLPELRLFALRLVGSAGLWPARAGRARVISRARAGSPPPC